MTDAEWNAGMSELILAFPYPILDKASAKKRSALYRERFGELSAKRWQAVVTAVIDSETERTFPPVAIVLDHVRRTPEPWTPERALPPSSLTTEELEVDREKRRRISRRGIELIRQAAIRAGLLAEGVRHPIVETTNERKAALKRALTHSKPAENRVTTGHEEG